MISNSILYNPFLLYFISAVAFYQFMLLIQNEDYFFLGLFIVVSFLTSVFSKNLIVIFCTTLSVVFILKSKFNSDEFSEGFRRRRRRRRRRRGGFKRFRKRFNKKMAGARRKLFGRTKREKKRAARARADQDALTQATNTRLEGEITALLGKRPNSETKTTNVDNIAKGLVSERYAQNIIDFDSTNVDNKLGATKDHLNQAVTDIKNALNAESNYGGNLNNTDCKDGGKCGLYARKAALTAVEQPLQDLYKAILHGPVMIGEEKYDSGNIVN